MIPGLINLSYSTRRYFVDDFFLRHVPLLKPGSNILDLGGNKISKRGRFNIESYDHLQVTYADISTLKRPDVKADAEHLPFKSSCFDAVICAELFEHIRNPEYVLVEIDRVMKPGGTLLITAPFLFRIHGDPEDYARYTETYWRSILISIGFRQFEIEKQGLFWSVLIDMVRSLIDQRVKDNNKLVHWIGGLVNWWRRRALLWEAMPEHRIHPFYSSFTTGFGIIAKKPADR